MNRLRRAIAELHPASAALVMATGIVSTGLALFGWTLLSYALLVVAVAAFAVLVVAYAWRVVAYPRRVVADAQDPGRAFGYFTLVAAANVVGIRLGLDHRPFATAALALAAIPVWLLLTYAVPAALVTGNRLRDGAAPDERHLVPVGGEHPVRRRGGGRRGGLASRPGGPLAPLAVAFWSIGVVLYVILTCLVTTRLLADPVDPHALGPAYWVYMGDTAITVLAAAKILALPATLPVLVATRDVVSGVAFVLWAFGTWWIPMLLLFTVWRHFVPGARMGYEPTLWGMVFPLGMYAVAGASYGDATGLGFMVAIARVEVWVGFVAWTGVAIAMARALLRPSRAGPARTADSDSPPGLTRRTR